MTLKRIGLATFVLIPSQCIALLLTLAVSHTAEAKSDVLQYAVLSSGITLFLAGLLVRNNRFKARNAS